MNLHWNVYGGGIANQLMSIQVGIILSFLSKRKLTLYQKYPLAFSNKGLFINDLFDFNFDFMKSDINTASWIPADFSTCYYHLDKPNEDFIFGRECVNISDYQENDIGSSTANTLGYYSFKIFFNDCKKEAVQYLIDNLLPKEKYQFLARKISDELGCKNSIHVRRGDFCQIEHFANNYTASFNTLENTIYNNFYHYPILVHTNEEDEKYFKSENELIFIDKIIKEKHKELDDVEVSLISMLIAMRSDNFLGSLGSTFTGLIHQNKKLNNPESKFKYLFSNSSALNRFGEEIKVNGKYTWNQLKLKHWSECNWQREYPECIDIDTEITNAEELNFSI